MKRSFSVSLGLCLVAVFACFSVAIAYDYGNWGWQQLPSDSNAPSPRAGHVAVWTGSEMIIWGGTYNDYYNGQLASFALGDGAIYNPESGEWRPISMENAPAPRQDCAAVWTGDELIILPGTVHEVLRQRKPFLARLHAINCHGKQDKYVRGRNRWQLDQ